MASLAHKNNTPTYTMTKVNNSGNTKDDLLENCTSFINSYDGSADAFANSERFMKDIFHPDFTFLTEEGPKDLRWRYQGRYQQHGKRGEDGSASDELAIQHEESTR
ncbi:hypothetical protein ACHAXA_011278 [Cyclostephanos tholiformis]|uniref:Uncharacterized protein n=1 Tax=Cyclostephanos tholiformis TaxID=382380 RepID=A0ABD3SPF4_9STRA